jgi:hypothetical protein
MQAMLGEVQSIDVIFEVAPGGNDWVFERG